MLVLQSVYYSPQKFSKEDMQQAMELLSSEAQIKHKLHRVSSSFLTENITNLHYKDKLVQVVYRDHRCVLQE